MSLVIRDAQMEAFANSLPGPVIPCPLYIWIRIAVRDYFHRPYEKCRYLIEAEGTKLEGVSTAEGVAAARLPRGVTSGTLSVWVAGDEGAPESWNLEIGKVEPASTKPGAVARLFSLEFLIDEADAADPLLYADALGNFQAWVGLEPTGKLDARTAELLDLACQPNHKLDPGQSSLPPVPGASEMRREWERMLEINRAYEPEDEEE